MRLHKKGYVPMLVVLAILLLIVWLINIIFPKQSIIHYILYGIGIVFYALVVRFFRHPLRNVAVNEDHILGAADGVVVAIEEIYESEFYHDKRLQISVFMSPLNVHVNWYPISGEIIYTKYFKGRYHAAYLPKASKENERMSIVIENEQKKSVMMVQIAGLMARRVYTNAREGNYVFQGEEAGIIKFGSRVDLILPVNVEVLVELNQKVRACSTIIAKFRPE
jgi:phosphatidylserine decarboxylase